MDPARIVTTVARFVLHYLPCAAGTKDINVRWSGHLVANTDVLECPPVVYLYATGIRMSEVNLEVDYLRLPTTSGYFVRGLATASTSDGHLATKPSRNVALPWLLCDHQRICTVSGFGSFRCCVCV